MFQTGRAASQLEDNWNHIIEKIDRQIQLWSKRNLSIQGKIIIAKNEKDLGQSNAARIKYELEDEKQTLVLVQYKLI